MKLNWKFLVLLVALVGLQACQDDNDFENPDVLIFGTFFGLCQDDCIDLFKIEDGDLFRDEVAMGVPDAIPFSSAPMSGSDYRRAVDLLNDFPEALVDDARTTYGCPNCADQGGIYLELRRPGLTRKWEIDPDETLGTPELDAYRDAVWATVADLK